MGRRAAIVGASGLVGQRLLRALLESSEIDAVLSLGRRPAGLASPKLREVQLELADPAASGRLSAALAEARPDDLFCCLGTTLKKAGSQEAFRRVDLEAPLAFARAGLAAGASQFVLCSAVGADPQSGVFYNRTKGEVEAGLRGLGFARGLKAVRPSMLLGERAERRPLEAMVAAPMKWLQGAFAGPLWPYRPIAVEQVARAMLNAALREMPGDRVYQGKPLFHLAGFA